MYKRLWRLLTGLVAIACGIAFGFLAGIGLVRADPSSLLTSRMGTAESTLGIEPADGVGAAAALDYPSRVLNQSSRRCQPSAASVGRKLGR